MRWCLKKISELKERMDPNYHLSESSLNGETWELDEIKDIIVRDPNCYGFNYCKKGIPIIRIGDLKNPFIDFTNVAKISPDIHNKFKKTTLEKYDILMSVRGVSIGKIGIFLGEYDEANISPNIIIIRLKEKDLAQYVSMFLVSDIGQSQIKSIIAGTSKPTITAPLIGKIKIPKPNTTLLKHINDTFNYAYCTREKSKQIISKIEDIFDEEFNYAMTEKELCYPINVKALSDRWDPHYHNPRFDKLRVFINEFPNNKKITLSDIYDNIQDVEVYSNDTQIGYIEINSVNNVTGIIEEYSYDYIKKHPTGRKITLKNGDLLIPKVRPYRNATTMYVKNNDNIVTASENAFAIYRIKDFGYPYYVVSFLRYSLGLNQIIMMQSGTTYPTVSEDEIKTLKVLLVDITNMEVINSLYLEYIEAKESERASLQTIKELLSSFNKSKASNQYK